MERCTLSHPACNAAYLEIVRTANVCWRVNLSVLDITRQNPSSQTTAPSVCHHWVLLELSFAQHGTGTVVSVWNWAELLLLLQWENRPRHVSPQIHLSLIQRVINYLTGVTTGGHLMVVYLPSSQYSTPPIYNFIYFTSDIFRNDLSWNFLTNNLHILICQG